MHPKVPTDIHAKPEEKTIYSTQQMKITHHEDAQLIVDLLNDTTEANDEMKQLIQLLDNPQKR